MDSCVGAISNLMRDRPSGKGGEEAKRREATRPVYGKLWQGEVVGGASGRQGGNIMGYLARKGL